MKLPCEMIRDLLPLYHDGVCSQVSEELVQAHLEECEDCQRILKGIDTEIQVPELEMDAAKPLISIQVNWEKQTRKTKWKYIACGIVTFFMAVAMWWGLTRWCIVPLKAEDYIIKAAEQLENGTIHIEYSLMYETAYPNEGVTEDGILYDYRTRPILAKRREQIPDGSAGIYLEPDDRTWFGGEPFHAFCLGKPGTEESILIWEEGMELPAASMLTEEMYASFNSSFEVPNAPKKPKHIRYMQVERLNGSIYGEVGRNVEETEVSASVETQEK